MLILKRAVWQLWEDAWQGRRGSRAAGLSPCLVHSLLGLVPPAQPHESDGAGASQLWAPRRISLTTSSRHYSFSTNLLSFSASPS